MNKKEQLQNALSSLMGRTDLPATALEDVTNIVNLVNDVNTESENAIKESLDKYTTLSKAYTELAIHGKVASDEEPQKEEHGKTLEEIAQEIKLDRKRKER